MEERNKKQLNQEIGHGFLPDIQKTEDYVLGGAELPTEVLQENGQWDIYLPENELQRRNGLETMNCNKYGTLNCIEVLILRLFNLKQNYSERYIGVMSRTSKSGNSPQRVIETIRKESGLIKEELLPFDETIDEWDKYYSPDPMTQNYIDEGQKWLKQYEVGHEWVYPVGQFSPEKLMEALKYSPIGVSVYAWVEHNGLFIKPEGSQDNHWCMLYGYEKEKCWKIFDHYDDTTKELEWDYPFGFAKRYYIKKKEEEPKKESWWQRLLSFIKSLF